MKKVVFGITSLRPGGAERVLIDIANHLKDKYDITIFSLYGDGEFEKQLDPSIHFYALHKHTYESYSKLRKICFSLQLVIPFFRNVIYKKYFKNKYDVEIAFLEGPMTWLMSGKSNAKKIVWVHNDLICVYSKTYLKRKMSEKAYSKYQKIIFVSQDNLNKFKQLYPKNKIAKQVIYNYIDKDIVNQKANLFSVDEIQTDLPSFLQVSRLTEQKAILRLVKVHKKLIEDGVMHRIYIIGDGPLKDQIIQKVKELHVEDTFILLGQKENPYPYIKKANIFMLASYYEGYPMVLLEAKVLNKKILITESASREVLLGYEDGNIVPNTEDGIYSGMKQIVMNQDFKINHQEFKNDKILEEIEELLGE